MSRETMKHLNTEILRGFTDKRGHAWHYSAALQGAESNHYAGAIPVADLHRRLFNFNVESRPLYVETANGLTTVDGRVAWCRDDNDAVLGIHGSESYSGHAYGEWCVRNVENMVDDTLNVASAGLLKGGAVAWVQIETPDNIETPEGVTVRPFILATTSFDGSIATTYKDGYTDVVCDNTRDAFMAEKTNVYRVKHTRNSRFDVLDARTALGILHANTDGFMAEIKALCAVNTYAHHLGTVRNVSRVERNMLRAVTGGVASLDRGTLTTLETVMDRKITVPARPTLVSMAS